MNSHYPVSNIRSEANRVDSAIFIVHVMIRTDAVMGFAGLKIGYS